MPGRRRFLRVLAGGAGAGVVALGAPAAAQAPPDTGGLDLGEDPRRSLQAALDRTAAAGGGTVVVPPGTHQVDGELVVPSNVALVGSSRTACRLVGAVVRLPAGVEGAAVEDLTLDGGAAGVVVDADGPDQVAAAFCIVRRLRIAGVAGTAVALRGGRYQHLYLEQLWIDGPGRHGVALEADGECQAVFLSEVSVAGPGAAGGSGAHGVLLGGRCQLVQVQVVGIGPGAVGIGFAPGSDHAVATNLSLTTEGGTAIEGQADRVGVVVGPFEVDAR